MKHIQSKEQYLIENTKYKSFLWKIYFYVISLLIIFSHAIILYEEFEKVRIWEFIDIPFALISLVGLFSYVYKRKVLNRIFWKFFLISIIIWDIFYIFIIGNLPDTELTVQENNISILIGYCIYSPTYFALLKYIIRLKTPNTTSRTQN